MPNPFSEDTIAAIATPAGEGGISVIRISGPQAFSIVSKIFCSAQGRLEEFSSHTIHYGTIQDKNGQVVDQVLASLFRAPHSYTGEDVIEISSHGGLVVTKKILDVLFQEGARHAEPGEFTKRAFLNGKMDLIQAEAVLDLIRAKSEKARQTALAQLSGSLSRRFKSLKDELMKIYAHLEAFLDFPDEHLEVYGNEEFLFKFREIGKEMDELVRDFRRGSILREGVTIVLAGKPNVGKSSLFNALLARDRALVSEFPGTTRDALEEALEIEGFYVRLIDTAGLSSTPEHPVDRLGMERTRLALKEADLLLFLVDGSAPLEEADRIVFAELAIGKPIFVLVNKSDLPAALHLEDLHRLTQIDLQEYVKISTKTREGLSQFEKEMESFLLAESATAKEGRQITRLRHKNSIERARQALARAEEALARRESLEFIAVDLKAALDELRELIGEIYSEDLLDVIFSEFCIGK